MADLVVVGEHLHPMTVGAQKLAFLCFGEDASFFRVGVDEARDRGRLRRRISMVELHNTWMEATTTAFTRMVLELRNEVKLLLVMPLDRSKVAIRITGTIVTSLFPTPLSLCFCIHTLYSLLDRTKHGR